MASPVLTWYGSPHHWLQHDRGSWVRKEIQRAIAEQEFVVTVPPALTGRLVVLRGLLGHDTGDVEIAAAALGLAPGTLHRQLATIDVVGGVDDEEGDYGIADPSFDDPELTAVTGSMLRLLRRALATLEHQEAGRSSCASA